jgi:hypothetical protein
VGRWAREAIERKFLRRIPGYTIVRDLADQIAGDQGQKAWKPVLVEMEDGLVPAFMIEELADGLCTVFVPAVPTPLTGAVFILDRRRIHVLDIPFTQAIKTVTHWGEGAGQLIEAMRDRENTLEASDDRLDFDRKAEPCERTRPLGRFLRRPHCRSKIGLLDRFAYLTSEENKEENKQRKQAGIASDL